MSRDTKEDLAAAIFGHSDSELSSDDDDVAPRPTHARRQSPRAPADEDGSDDSADDYQHEKRAPRPKRRTKPRKDDEEGRPGTARKRKRRTKPVPEEIDLSQLPPEVAAKMKLDMQIEAILKPKKASRPKRKKRDEDVLDRYADEEVARLRDAMLAAAQDDKDSNREKLPATAKLRMLPQVMEVLRKGSLAQSIQDNNLLEAVARWLEPLPDKSLPALDIQKEFFPALRRMEFIDTSVLRESKLGPLMVFYAKCKRVTPDIARLANDLISTWSRPIIKRSASYRDRVIPTAQAGEGGPAAAVERLNAILARAKEGDKNRVRKNAVAIPQSQLGSYTVAPNANAGLHKTNVSVDVDVERRKKNAERLRSLMRKTKI